MTGNVDKTFYCGNNQYGVTVSVLFSVCILLLPADHTDRQSTNDNKNPIISKVWFGPTTDGKTDGHARFIRHCRTGPETFGNKNYLINIKLEMNLASVSNIS